MEARNILLLSVIFLAMTYLWNVTAVPINPTRTILQSKPINRSISFTGSTRSVGKPTGYWHPNQDLPRRLARGPRLHISDFTDPKTGLNPYIDIEEGVPAGRTNDPVNLMSKYITKEHSIVSNEEETKHFLYKKNQTWLHKTQHPSRDKMSVRAQKRFQRVPPINPTDNVPLPGGQSLSAFPVEGESGGRGAKRFFKPNGSPSGFSMQNRGMQNSNFRKIEMHKINSGFADDEKLELVSPLPSEQTQITVSNETENQTEVQGEYNQIQKMEKSNMKMVQKTNVLSKENPNSDFLGTTEKGISDQIEIIKSTEKNETDFEQIGHKQQQTVIYSIVIVVAASVFFAILMGICVFRKHANTRLKPKHRRQIMKQRYANANWTQSDQRATKHLNVSVF